MLKKHVKTIILLFIISRLILTTVGVLAFEYGPPLCENRMHGNSGNRLVDVWVRWDAGWYSSIVRGGYSTRDFGLGAQRNYAFFPSYPFLVRLLSHLTGDVMATGVLISNIAFLIGLVYLYKLVLIDYDRDISLTAVVYAIVFPTTLFFSAFLTESLFFMLVVSSFYYSRRKQWLRVGVLGFLASFTRSLGVFLFIPMLYEYLRQKKVDKNILFLFLIPLGFLFFMFYLNYLTGDYLAFAKVQGAWGRALQSPFSVLYGGFLTVHGTGQTALGFTLYALFCIMVMIKKRFRGSYILYGIISVLLPLSSGLTSMPRLVITVFPFYILMAALSENKRVKASTTTLFSLMAVSYMIFWSLCYPIIY